MKIKLLVITWLVPFSFLFSQNYNMNKPEGFGAAATGGGDTPSVTVSSWGELTAQLKSASPKVIVVSGIIQCSYTSVLVKNKTLIGLSGARLVNIDQTAAGSGILNLKAGSDNIIIRNLVFEGPGAFDVDGHDNLTSEATNLWVDHCEFQDGMDGNFDNKGAADNVTVSWTKFTYLKTPKANGTGGADDHRFSNLIGSGKNDFPADGHYSITFKNCYWAHGCKQRMPRARNAEIHVLNCLYKTSESGSVAIGLGGGQKNATCYVEATDFEEVEKVFKEYISTDGGKVGIAFDNCHNGASNFGEEVIKPNYNYSKISLDKVRNSVSNKTSGAGATLQVSSTGEISSVHKS